MIEVQPGSNFKPFLYAAALENGYTAATLINDAPLDRSDYRPENFGGEFLGPISLKYALTNSKNLVSLRLYDALGEDIVMPYRRVIHIFYMVYLPFLSIID